MVLCTTSTVRKQEHYVKSMPNLKVNGTAIIQQIAFKGGKNTECCGRKPFFKTQNESEQANQTSKLHNDELSLHD